MIVQIALLHEAFAALVARVVANAGVDALVGHQVRLRAEFFRALVALVAIFQFGG